MAKRGAASELNHDNWEDEEEAEEAGEFRKASEAAMKGRVVRKAKRRNLTEDQKKNVFQGFGGFTSTNQTAEQAFSFLGKKEDKEEAKEDKEDKDGKDDEVKEKALAGFTFGSLAGNGDTKEDEENEKKETTKVEEASKTEDEKKDKTETKVEEAPKTDDLMAKFMTKSSDKWACSVCMVSNPSDKAACLACETPKPGAAPAGGAPSSDSKPTFNFGGGGGFKFVDAAASKPETSFGSFKFGASESPAAPAAAGGGFKFGASEPAQAQAGGFRFGASEAPTAAPEGGGGFKFGASASTSPLAAAASGAGGCSLPSTGKPAGQPATDTPSKGVRREYLAALKTLNTQVTNWIKSHVDSNPLVDLSPVFADYSRHLQALREKHDIKAPVTEKKVVHKITEDDNEAPENKEAPEQKENTEPKPFSFGFGSTAVSSGFGSTSGGFSFGGFAKKEETSKEDTEDGEEEAVKVEEVVEEVEEEGAVYSKKCKLFYKKEEAWVERGLGQLHLKVPEEGKVQMVVRAGTSLGNILLNVLVSSATALERVGKNNLMLVTVPNPPIDPKAEPAPVPFLVRVKTAEDADELKEKLVSLAKTEGKEA